MLNESVDEKGMGVTEIVCSIKPCTATYKVSGGTRDERNLDLYHQGWRLYKEKQLCPTHARQIAELFRIRK